MAGAHRTIALAVAGLMLAPVTSQAQDARRDSVWNGVVIGAGVGASLGVVLGATTDSICSVPTCMTLVAIAGAAIGRVVDSSRGQERVVEPGSLVDDPLLNGALIGAAVGSSAVVIDYAAHGCGPAGAPAPCGGWHIFADAVRGALFTAGVGAVIDAAIPSRANRASEASGEQRSGRRVAVAFRVRF